MTTKKSGLGRGLGTLLRDEPQAKQEAAGADGGQATHLVPLTYIETNPYQPRVNFDQEALAELADSIKVHGIIQPVSLRRLSENRYQIIAGERRCQASRLAGIETVPAYVRKATDQQMLEVALIENIQRADLGPMEIARSYQRLITEIGITQEDLSARVHKKRATIANYLRLLRLPPDVQMALEAGLVSMGHAKAILSVEQVEGQLTLLRLITTHGLSVRQAEDWAKQPDKPVKKEARPVKKLGSDFAAVQGRLRDALGLQVLLAPGKSGRGKLTIPYTSADDLERLIDLLDPAV